MMIGMAGFDVPIWIIRRQIASAIHLIVQVARLSGGVRRVVKVSEVTGMEGDIISMQDIFSFNQSGVDKERRDRPVQGGRHTASVPQATVGQR